MLSSQDAKMPVVNNNEDSWIEEPFDLINFINSPRNTQDLNMPVMEQNPFPRDPGMDKSCHNNYQADYGLVDDFEFDQLQLLNMGNQAYYGEGDMGHNFVAPESPRVDDYIPNSSVATNVQPHLQQGAPVVKIKEEFDPDFSPSSIAPSLGQYDNDDVEYVPKIKPRKYQIKPESERCSTTYKQKRAKNNDAVRKSRNKAKIQQQARDQQLKECENKIAEYEKRHTADKKTIAQLNSKVTSMSNQIGRLQNRIEMLEGRPRCVCNGFP